MYNAHNIIILDSIIFRKKKQYKFYLKIVKNNLIACYAL